MRETVNFLIIALPIIVLFILVTSFSRIVRHPKRIIPEDNGRKKISSNPSFFGGSSNKNYYFDDDFLYEVDKRTTYEIGLTKITQIKPGYTKVNNRRKWTITYIKEGEKKQVQFYPNLTVFNHNFADFLTTVKRVNPDAEVKNVSLFNM